MNYQVFHVLHLFSVFCLVGLTFQAVANPDPARRKKTLMWAGIASLGALLGGFGLLAFLAVGFPKWAIVKRLCWLLLSGIAGMVYRMREKANFFCWLATGLIATAVLMVSYKPF